MLHPLHDICSNLPEKHLACLQCAFVSFDGMAMHMLAYELTHIVGIAGQAGRYASSTDDALQKSGVPITGSDTRQPESATAADTGHKGKRPRTSDDARWATLGMLLKHLMEETWQQYILELPSALQWPGTAHDGFQYTNCASSSVLLAVVHVSAVVS